MDKYYICNWCKTIGYSKQNLHIYLDKQKYLRCINCPTNSMNYKHHDELLFFNYEIFNIIKILFW